MECGEFSPLSAGDLSPSNRAVCVEFFQTAERGSAWPTSRPSGQSCDKSPHSKFSTDARRQSAVGSRRCSILIGFIACRFFSERATREASFQLWDRHHPGDRIAG
jgi:hypothetical protein